MSASRTLAVRNISARYPGSTEHIQAVRADLRGLLNDYSMADDAILCASELATNAVVHSRSGLTGGYFLVRAALSLRDGVLIEVMDEGGQWREAGNDPVRPHGLDIIRLLATDWGIAGDSRSRTVWVRLGWPEDGTAVCGRPS